MSTSWSSNPATSAYDLSNIWSGDGPTNQVCYFSQGIAVTSDHYVYVSDQITNRVQKFDEHGNFVLRWGCARVAATVNSTAHRVWESTQAAMCGWPTMATTASKNSTPAATT